MIIFLKLRELHEKECKHIICSEFPRCMACTKPGSEGVKFTIDFTMSTVSLLVLTSSNVKFILITVKDSQS